METKFKCVTGSGEFYTVHWYEGSAYIGTVMMSPELYQLFKATILEGAGKWQAGELDVVFEESETGSVLFEEERFRTLSLEAIKLARGDQHENN